MAFFKIKEYFRRDGRNQLFMTNYLIEALSRCPFLQSVVFLCSGNLFLMQYFFLLRGFPNITNVFGKQPWTQLLTCSSWLKSFHFGRCLELVGYILGFIFSMPGNIISSFHQPSQINLLDLLNWFLECCSSKEFKVYLWVFRHTTSSKEAQTSSNCFSLDLIMT